MDIIFNDADEFCMYFAYLRKWSSMGKLTNNQLNSLNRIFDQIILDYSRFHRKKQVLRAPVTQYEENTAITTIKKRIDSGLRDVEKFTEINRGITSPDIRIGLFLKRQDYRESAAAFRQHKAILKEYGPFNMPDQEGHLPDLGEIDMLDMLTRNDMDRPNPDPTSGGPEDQANGTILTQIVLTPVGTIQMPTATGGLTSSQTQTATQLKPSTSNGGNKKRKGSVPPYKQGTSVRIAGATMSTLALIVFILPLITGATANQSQESPSSAVENQTQEPETSSDTEMTAQCNEFKFTKVFEWTDQIEKEIAEHKTLTTSIVGTFSQYNRWSTGNMVLKLGDDVYKEAIISCDTRNGIMLKLTDENLPLLKDKFPETTELWISSKWSGTPKQFGDLFLEGDDTPVGSQMGSSKWGQAELGFTEGNDCVTYNIQEAKFKTTNCFQRRTIFCQLTDQTITFLDKTISSVAELKWLEEQQLQTLRPLITKIISELPEKDCGDKKPTEVSSLAPFLPITGKGSEMNALARVERFGRIISTSRYVKALKPPRTLEAISGISSLSGTLFRGKTGKLCQCKQEITSEISNHTLPMQDVLKKMVTEWFGNDQSAKTRHYRLIITVITLVITILSFTSITMSVIATWRLYRHERRANDAERKSQFRKGSMLGEYPPSEKIKVKSNIMTGGKPQRVTMRALKKTGKELEVSRENRKRKIRWLEDNTPNRIDPDSSTESLRDSTGQTLQTSPWLHARAGTLAINK